MYIQGLRCAWGFPGGSDGKESACSARDPDSIPGSGRSPGEGNGNPLQYSYLENSMDRGAWRALQFMGHKESDTAEQLTLSLYFRERQRKNKSPLLGRRVLFL